MSDDINLFSETQSFIGGCCYVVVLIITTFQIFKLARICNIESLRGAVHICIFFAAMMGVIDQFNTANEAKYSTPPSALSYYPYVLIMYFLTTAYLLTLVFWMGMYHNTFAASRGSVSVMFPKMRIFFIVVDVSVLLVLLASATVFYGNFGQNDLADSLYSCAVGFIGIGLAFGFAVYGVLLIMRMKHGSRHRARSSDIETLRVINHTSQYPATVKIVSQQTVALCVTMLSGSGLAIFFSFFNYDLFSQIALMFQTIVVIALMAEMLYILRPQHTYIAHSILLSSV